MSQNCNIEYSVVEEGEQVLEFKLPTTSQSDYTIIIDDPEIITFVGSQNTEQNCFIIANKCEYLELLNLTQVKNVPNNKTDEFGIVSSKSSSVSDTVINGTDTMPPKELICDGMFSDSTNNELIPTRKRRRKPDNWRVIERNKKYQAGLEFVNNKGQLRPKKEIRYLENCLSVCKKRCAIE